MVHFQFIRNIHSVVLLVPIDDIFNLKYSSDWNNVFLFYRAGLISTEHAFNDAKVQQLIQSENVHFDVIVLEQFNHDAFLLFAHKFKAPIITIATLGHADYLDHAMGLITPWSHVPHNMLTYTDQMSFTQRCYNMALSLLDTVLRRYHYMPKMQQLADTYFISSDGLCFRFGSVCAKSILYNEISIFTETKPSILELEKNIAIRLVNSHTTTSHPRPSMPGLVNVAGVHIRPPKPLPADIQVNQVLFRHLFSYIHFFCYCFRNTRRFWTAPIKREPFISVLVRM